MPKLHLTDHLMALGLHEHIKMATRDLIGSPMLFDILNATKEWLESHPFSVHASLSTAPTDSAKFSKTAECNQAVCKFFSKGSCKFGSKCWNYHPGSIQPEHHDQEDVGCNDDIQVPNVAKIAVMKKETHSEEVDDKMKKESMRTAADVISRIRWDPALSAENFMIGYLDRFVGIIEKPFGAFSWEDLTTVAPDILAVPEHRIQYFKYLDEVVWDKTKQLDNMFGSLGGKLIQDVILAYSGCVSKSCDDIKIERDSTSLGLSESNTGLHMRRNEVRPTHFVCIRVTDQYVASSVEKIQEHVVKHSPELSDACLPLTVLHVTICMMQLNNPSHISTARKVMENTKQYFTQCVPKCTDLVFSAIDHFHDRLLYAKVAPNPALHRLSSLLIERFQDAGLKTPGNRDRFTPHMTLLKMSRSLQHMINSQVIRRDSYSAFGETYIGKQRVDGIYLCSITGPEQDDGFFHRIHFVSNSLLNLSPIVPSLFSKLAHLLETNGFQSVRELEFFESDTTKFDNSVEAIEDLLNSKLYSQTCNPQESKVVILRGLPGSGKSYLTEHCSEKNIVVCSSDMYFKDKSGGYKFNRKLLPEAHAQCCQHFIQAISDGRKLVVVDNTNSMKWEYKIYIYLSQVLGLQYHIIEFPHPNQYIVSAFCSRNLHNVDMVSIKSYTDHWEEEERAILVPPRIAYPKSHCQLTDSNPPSSFFQPSLLNICQIGAGILPDKLSTFSVPLDLFFTGIFLTARAQWELVSAVAPTHSRVYAEHVTLAFKPSIESLEFLEIGKKVTVTVWGVGNDGKVQAVTVDIPDGISCQNENPHVTISTIPSSLPKFSNNMLSSHPARHLPSHLKLEGVIGVAVKESSPSVDENSDNQTDAGGGSAEEYYPILSKQYFNKKVAPRLCRTPHKISLLDDSSVSICIGDQTVTELFVYDFDGTLFDSPLRIAGMQEYEMATGQKWPYKDWWGVAESLLPPLKVKPGLALASFQAHCGRSGSYTVILTARIQRTKVGVETVLTNYDVHPDLLILKPNNTSEYKNSEFKVDYLKTLLERFPDTQLVKFWDDNDDNLRVLEEFAKNIVSGVKFDIINATQMNLSTRTPSPTEASPTVLKSFLSKCGLLSTPEHCSAALTGVRFIAEQFGKITDFEGNPSALAHLFGSYCFGRKNDVDLCLLAPPHLSPVDCMEKLNNQLEKCGIDYLHNGYSSRCPRLKIQLDFRTTPSVEYDVVFAVLNSQDLFNSCEELSVTSGSEKLLKDDDASKTALLGPIFLCRVQDIISGTVSCESFGVVLEMIVQMLKAHRLKGNCYRCIRTFHIVQLLADFILTHKKKLLGVSCDTLFQEFILHSALLPASTWEKLCADCVAKEYIPRIMGVFKTWSKILQINKGKSVASYYEETMKRPPFPPCGYIPVRILCSAKDCRTQWELETVLAARLPTYISKLFSCGLDVIPDGNDICGSVCFAVRNTNTSAATVQDVFRKFWNEFPTYHKLKGVNMELKIDNTEQKKGIKMDFVSNNVIHRVTEFASSDLSDLHLSASLTSYERRLVHEAAEKLRVNHRTEGEGKERHIHLYK